MPDASTTYQIGNNIAAKKRNVVAKLGYNSI